MKRRTSLTALGSRPRPARCRERRDWMIAKLSQPPSWSTTAQHEASGAPCKTSLRYPPGSTSQQPAPHPGQAQDVGSWTDSFPKGEVSPLAGVRESRSTTALAFSVCNASVRREPEASCVTLIFICVYQRTSVLIRFLFLRWLRLSRPFLRTLSRTDSSRAGDLLEPGAESHRLAGAC